MTGDMHPSVRAILRYFEYAHLPEDLQVVSAPIGILARSMAERLPSGPELTKPIISPSS